MGFSTRSKLAVVVGTVLVALVVVLSVVLTMDNDEYENPWESEIRLPFSVVPSRYDILLHPDLVESSPTFGNFTGTVKIEIDLKEDRRWFVVHAKYLELTNSVLENSEGTVEIKAPFEVPKNEWWTFKPAKESFPKGSYTLTLNFKGLLTRNIVGFYRSVYTNSNGDSRYIATTKFEPTYARLAFPCFDEPAMKASYKVRLVKPKGYIALSNSDMKSETTDNEKNLSTVEFSETVKMSSYLAAFIVCDFVVQNRNVDVGSTTLPINIYARQDQISNTNEALNVAVFAVPFYTKYFGIEYPMPKVDLIAIPDFVSGAMENWGLITFRETSVLFDSKENSAANREGVSGTTAHELAHMWFGNLVTMKWWTDLWLNEGFATFMAQKCLAAMHSDWDYTNQFVVDTLLSVLTLDAALSSHPVLQEVSHPDQITEIFDTISYNKGSSVILMLETFMGEENFKRGLNSYLKIHQYNNAETADLWRALQDYAPEGVNVAKVMDTWTRQMGFPVITVNRAGSGNFILSQKRFLSNRDAEYDPSTSKYRYKWDVPIFYSTSTSETSKLVWLHSDQDQVEIPADASVKWVKVNSNQRGYFRVNYDDEGWNGLLDTLIENVDAIKPIDRAGLLDDVFSLADAEEVKYETALNLSKYLIKEESFVAWYIASSVFKTLLQRLPQLEPLKRYALKQIDTVVRKLSWDVQPADHLQSRLRTLILGLACELNSTSELSKASELLNTWLSGGNKPDPDIRSVVYTHGLKNSDSESQWNILLEKFKSETNTQEKVKLMFALATTSNEALLQKYLIIAKDESIIRSQDYFTVLSYICDNPKGVQLVWDFYRNEYEYLLTRFTLNDRTFGRFISRISSKFDTESRLKEVEEFFRKYPDAGAGKAARAQSLEGIKGRIKWLLIHRTSVEDWLASL